MEETLSRPAARPRSRARHRLGGLLSGCVGAIFKLLSVLLVLATLAFAGAVAAVFQFPNLAGMLPPTGAWLVPTQPMLVALLPTLTPEPTATPEGTPAESEAFPTLPPEWTPTDTPTVTLTPLPPTATRTPTATPTGPSATPGPTNATARTPTPAGTEAADALPPTATRTRSAFAFNLLNDSVTYLPNSINGSGCSWFGFAGQAFGLDGKPIINLLVHVEGDGVSFDIPTGSQPSVGPGGYVIPLGDHPVETTDIYTIQLRNNTGTALSDNFVVRTHGDCDRNLVLVNFVQNH